MPDYNTGTGATYIDPLIVPSLAGNNLFLVTDSDGKITLSDFSATSLSNLNALLSNGVDLSAFDNYTLLTTFNPIKNLANSTSSSFITFSNSQANSNVTLTNLISAVSTSNISLSNTVSANTLSFTTLSNLYKATSNYVDSIVSDTQQDLSGLATVSNFSNLSNLYHASSNYLNTIVSDTQQDLSGLATISSVTSLSNLYHNTSNYVNTIISDTQQDLSGLATVTNLNALSNLYHTSSNYLNTIVSDTQQDLSGLTPLSSFNTLSNYVSTLEVTSGDAGFDLTGFSNLSNAYVATSNYVASIDLADYTLLEDFEAEQEQLNSLQTLYTATSNYVATIVSGGDTTGFTPITLFEATSNSVVSEKLRLTTLSNYVSTIVSDTDQDLSGLTPLTTFNVLSNLYHSTSNYVNTIISDTTPDLSGLATVTNLNALSNLYHNTSNYVNTIISDTTPDLSGYATVTNLNTTNTNLSSLSNLYHNTSNYVNTIISDTTPDLSGYATVSSLNTTNTNLSTTNTNLTSLSNLYNATSNYVNTIISDTTPDLSGYATVTNLNSLSNLYHNSSNLVDTHTSVLSTLSGMILSTDTNVTSLSNLYINTSNQVNSNTFCITSLSNLYKATSNLVTTNSTSISTNTSAISSLSNLYTNTSNLVNTNVTNISTISGNVTSLSNLYINTSNLVNTNTTGLSNLSKLYTNTSNLVNTNSSSILTNTANITTNASSISALNILYVNTSNYVNTLSNSGGGTGANNYSITYSNLSSNLPITINNVKNDYKFRATASATQTLANGTYNPIQFNTVSYDINANYNNSTYTYTAPVTGYYSVSYSIYNGYTTTTRNFQAEVYINGTTSVMAARCSDETWTSAPTGQAVTQSANDTIKLTAGDTMIVRAAGQGSTVAGIQGNYFSCHLLSVDTSSTLSVATSNYVTVNSYTYTGTGNTMTGQTNSNGYIPTWSSNNSTYLNNGIDPATIATLTGTQTLTNKTIDYSTNTITNLPSSQEFTQTSIKTSSYTAVSGNEVLVDALNAVSSFAITLPASPSLGAKVRITMVASHSTRIITLSRNGSSIDGGTTTEFETYYTLWSNGDNVTLIYVGNTVGWTAISRNIKNRFLARAYLSTNQTGVAVNANTKVNLNTIDYDPNGSFDVTTNRRWTCPITGKYMVHISIAFTGVASAKIFNTICYKNGAGSVFFTSLQSSIANDVYANASSLINLVQGDYLELYFFQNSSTSVAINSGNNITYLDVSLHSR